MNSISIRVLALSTLALASSPIFAGVSIPSSPSELAAAKRQPPPRPACEVIVKKTITVSGDFDGKGCVYTWRGAGYPKYCRAPKEISEDQPPMFNLKPGAKLRNLHLECALDGIHTSKNNVIDNVINRDVEEDAITIGQNIVIRNSSFYFCQDKCLQMNTASNVTIENNKFYYATSPILANYGKSVVVRNNYFFNVKKAIRANKRVGVASDIRASGNQIDTANCGLASQNGAKTKDEGGNQFTNVESRTCN